MERNLHLHQRVRVLQVGNEIVIEPLRELGHEVIGVFERWPELNVVGQPLDLREVWQQLKEKPDFLLVVDTLGRQMLPYGIEDLPVSKLYYAIDVHLNLFWQIHYGDLFDMVLLAQKDYVPLFESAGIPAHWLPWGIDEKIFHDRGLQRQYELCFVGTVDKRTRPKRTAIVNLLKERFGLVTFGERIDQRLGWERMAEVFGSAEIVFNESIMGELNFRVFEAMSCGAMLLTEKIENGLCDLFTPGVHLDVYTPETMVEKVEYYLSAVDERRRIGRRGAEEVQRRHTIKARMSEVVALVEQGIPLRRRSASAAFSWGMAAHLTVVRGLTNVSPGAVLAVENLRLAMEEDGRAEAAVAIARIFAWRNQNQTALAVLARARELDVTNIEAWMLAGELQRRLGNLKEAQDLFRGGLEFVPCVSLPTRRRALQEITNDVNSSSCLLALGLVTQEAGKPFISGLIPNVDAGLPWSAFDYFNAASAMEPSNSSASESMAALLEFLNISEIAASFHEMTVRCRPLDMAARSLLRESLAKAYRYQDAQQQGRTLACLRGEEPIGTATEKASAYREASEALEQGGDTVRAAAFLERAGELYSNDAELFKQCALDHLDLGDYAASRCYLEKALALTHSCETDIDEIFDLLDKLEEEANVAAKPA